MDMEDLQNLEQDLRNTLEDLEQHFSKFSAIIDLTDSKVSPEDLLEILENKIRDLNDKSQEVIQLQSNIRLLQSEVRVSLLRMGKFQITSVFSKFVVAYPDFFLFSE